MLEVPKHGAEVVPEASLLLDCPLGSSYGTVARTWENWPAGLRVPEKLLCADRRFRPTIVIVTHSMVNNPILRTIWRGSKGSMTNTICFRSWVLVENAIVVVLVPAGRLHWIVARKFQQSKTIVAIVRPCSRVDKELFIGRGVCQLLRTLI